MKRFGLMAMTALALVGCKESGSGDNSLDYLFVQMSKGDNWSIIDKNGKVVVEDEYPSDAQFSSINDGVFWVKQDNMWQLFSIDQPKQPVIDEEFKWATNFRCGRAVVSNPNEPIRIIDTKGKTVAQLGKNVCGCFPFNSAGYAEFVTQDKKHGIINANGKIVLKPEFFNIEVMGSDYIIVKKGEEDKNFQITDYKGHQLGKIDTGKYSSFSISDNGMIVANTSIDKRSVVALDKTGKKLFDIKKSSSTWSCYMDDYLVFRSSDEKFGVANDKGENVIRTKYVDIWNLGHGEFAAKKSDKWGVVDAKDETVLNFDYEYISAYKVGSYYLTQDGSTWALVGSNGKEVAHFDDYKTSSGDYYVMYVDVDGLATELMRKINVYEQPLTVAELAKEANLPLDENSSRSYSISFNSIVNDGMMEGSMRLYYNGRLAEEITHIEKVDDGWFTTEKVVSDGYGWSAAEPERLYGTLKLNENLGVDMSTLWKAVTSQMAQGRTMEADGVYSKTVKFGKQAMKCRTELGWNDFDFTIDITFSSN